LVVNALQNFIEKQTKSEYYHANSWKGLYENYGDLFGNAPEELVNSLKEKEEYLKEVWQNTLDKHENNTKQLYSLNEKSSLLLL
jgi:hypothetical protein